MKKTYLILLFLLGIHLFFLFNLRFTAWPEMFSFAYLRNSGFLLYKDMIHPYPPLLTLSLSYIYSIFGYGLEVLQTTTWLMLLTGSVFVFLIAKEVAGEKAGLFSLALYVFLQPFLEGNMMWPDTAMVLPLLLGTLLFYKKRYFWAGIAFGAAALVKQTAAIFLVLLLAYMLLKKFEWGKMARLLAGPFVLVAPLVGRLIQEGALQDFWKWTVFYPLTEWGSYPGYVQMSLNSREWLILLLLFIPLTAGFLANIVRRRDLQDSRLQLLGLFLIGGLIATYPRFSFFHFQVALAFLVIIYGYILGKAKWLARFSIWHLALVILAIFVVHRPVLQRDWQTEARFYGREDFKMAQIIGEKVPAGERVYLLGLHSGLYVLADRLPPKRWADNFGWYLEVPGVQEEIISRWQKNPPKVVFWQEPEPGQWYELGTYQPAKIASWIADNYTREEELKPGVWLWRLVLSEVEG